MCKFRQYDNYEVYEDGRIWSYYTNKFLKPGTNKFGYQQVVLTDNEGKQKRYQVHRIVYETFSGSPIPEGLQVNHIDENKENNNITNLNLMTCKENNNYGTRTDRAIKSLTNNPKLSKSVGAYKDGELLMTFLSTKEAHRNGFDSGHISACCRGKKKTHKGFEWRYI